MIIPKTNDRNELIMENLLKEGDVLGRTKVEFTIFSW
jgi:hypothetical protein